MEKFAQVVVETGNASEAARQAYNVSNDVSAASVGYENLRKPQVQELIEAKKEAIAIRNELTEDSIIAELEEARLLAAEIKNPASMVSASLGKAKTAGLLKEDQPVKPGNELVDDAIANPEFLEALVARWKERLAAGEALPTLGI